MNKKVLVLFVASLALAVFVVGAKFYRDDKLTQIRALPEELQRPHAFQTGEAQAPVTVVEFFDPECESCRRFHPLMKMLAEEFKGQIKFVYRYAPFHTNSQFVIKILEAARKQQRYEEVLAVLYQYQPEWGSHHHPRPELIWNYLPQVAGLDIQKIKTDMQDPGIVQIIQTDLLDGQKLGVRQTPHFFVNGEPLLDFGFENLRQLVKKHLISHQN